MTVVQLISLLYKDLVSINRSPEPKAQDELL